MKIKKWLLFEKEDLDQRIRSYPWFRGLLLLAAVIGFSISLLWLWPQTFSLKMKAYDYGAINWFYQIRTPFLINFFGLVTNLGNEIFLSFAFLVLATVLVLKRRKRAAAVSLLVFGLSVFFIYFLKSVFGRPRPIGCLENGDCLAFPSGHATISFYFYGLLLYLVFRFLPVSSRVFFFIGSGLVFLVFLIALSRLVLEVHYLSDVIGGLFLGGAWLSLAILLIDILYLQRGIGEKK